MITTDPVPGVPCWIDLGTPDVPAAAAFYSAVLGWTYEPMPGDVGESTDGEEMEGGMFKRDGRTVAGLGKLTEEGARSAWMIYYNVADADAATRAVEAAGGTVRVPPRDLGEWGRMAQFNDSLGGQFAVWQPGTDAGIELVDKPGSLSWTELYTTDADVARKFYSEVFGWWYSEVPLPGDAGAYALVTPAGLPAERMQGGIMAMPKEYLSLNGGTPYWHPVFDVEDCDAAVARVTANGGTVQMPPEDAEDVGRLSVCVDPSGADFVVLKPVAR
ncbi:VOC family protein [Streptomyces sp. NPDC000983]|uniref:VOC family protein n=1 Tax=Streptomyces sp. NPDC000983 TaxID=3154373 RepID=UPI003326B3F5